MFENIDSMTEVRSRMLSSDDRFTVVDANGDTEDVHRRAREALGL